MFTKKKSVSFIMDLEVYKLLRLNFIHINNVYDIGTLYSLYSLCYAYNYK